MGKQILLMKLSILTVSANFNKTVRNSTRNENENKRKFFQQQQQNEPDYSNDFSLRRPVYPCVSSSERC